MNDRHPIRTSIIASVAAGIILGALGLVWPPAKRLLGWLLGFLGTGVTLPIWALAVAIAATGGAAVAVGIALALKRSGAVGTELLESSSGRPPAPQLDIQPVQTGQAAYLRAEPEVADDVIEVSRLEADLLKRIAKEDDSPLYVDTLRRSLGITNIRLQTILDRLVTLDLIEIEEESDDDAVYLTAQGRRFVLEKRLAR